MNTHHPKKQTLIENFITKTQSDNENEIIEVIPTDIPRENLSKILQKIDEACDIATKFDPNLQRSQIFHNNPALPTYHQKT